MRERKLEIGIVALLIVLSVLYIWLADRAVEECKARGKHLECRMTGMIPNGNGGFIPLHECRCR